MKLKIRICQDCGTEMSVPSNSCKKRCGSCTVIWNRKKARDWYKGNIRLCRKRASKRLTEKLRDDPKYRLWSRAKARARELGLDFNLEQEDIKIPDRCPILKTDFEYKTYYTMSLDRIDSSKGYIKGNVWVISHKANAMKNSATEEELIKFSEWVLTSVKKEPNVPEVK